MPLFFSACTAKEELGSYRGYELPPYTVLQKEENTEIRQYAPQLMAEVTMEGERKEAVSAGFRILAAYIFGDNESAAKVAMTTPVTQEPASEKIAMTTPVTQKKSGDSWVVRFGMPKQYTTETLPKTKDTRIRFVTTKPKKHVAIRFSGFATDTVIAEQTKLLEAFITQQKLVRIGDPAIAYYDDPFTFPWNRRNEIMIEVK
ncbi:MAG: heme-binding protein [Rickettsiales bacterium]|nr:heme-binding protein [Rickettsiales bacterium]